MWIESKSIRPIVKDLHQNVSNVQLVLLALDQCRESHQFDQTYTTTSHIPSKRALETSSPMQRACVVPYNQVANVSPFDAKRVLLLCGVFPQESQLLRRLFLRQTFDISNMRWDVQVHATARLMKLSQLVPRERIPVRIELCKCLR